VYALSHRTYAQTYIYALFATSADKEKKHKDRDRRREREREREMSNIATTKTKLNHTKNT